jgi:nucleoporin SEH1
MRIFHRFPTHHDDLIHDISYDYYGKRLATCSSDQKIKVWDQNENGEWVLTTDWRAHSGSVWKLAWAHPEFGQIIASCSFDRTVVIWEEAEDEKGNKKWISRATLVDSRDSVSDIKFAPRHVGLKLATCSADGFVRIYEAIDVMNLAHWPLIDEFEAYKGVINCISWNPSPYYKPMLVVGSNDPGVKLWEYNDGTRKWVHVDTLNCGGPDNVVHDVSWSPNLGRSYHLIAVACKDRRVRIWKVSNTDRIEVLTRDDHHAEVWRVDWNITGTILASSGDDGNVRMWKANLSGEWKPLSVIQGEEDDDKN